MVNIELLRRAFDNLYANLVKYADMEKPVLITYQRESDQVHLSIANMVPDQQYQKNNKNISLMDLTFKDMNVSQMKRKESTNIGLNTCNRIIRMHKGTFLASEENNCFRVDILLPLCE